MKRLLLSVCLGLSLVLGFSQSFLGRYSSRITPDGTLMFIMPQKISKLQGLRHFDYDMTLLTWKDSVTVNFTYESDVMCAPSQVTLSTSSGVFKSNDCSPLFIDIKKNHYEIRITSRFPLKVISEFVNSETSPIFSFTQDGQEVSASYKPGAWKKDRKELQNIYHIFEYTK